MSHLSRRAAGTLILVLTACQGSSGPLAPPEPPPGPRAARLAAASPTAFALLPGEAVPTPEVTVSNAAGEGLPNIPVRFTVLGGGQVTQTEVLSNTIGQAATTWVLGIHPGINILLASTGNLPPVAFIAEGGYESSAESYGLRTSNQQAIPTSGFAGGALLLYGNGTFTQYHVLGSRVELADSRGITGSYVRDGAVITFSGAGASWTGTLNGDTVSVDGHEGWDPASYVLMSSVTECAPETASPTGGEGTTYLRLAPHRWPAGARSAFLLHGNTAFALRYVLSGGSTGEYLGSYSRSDSVITFHFDGWSIMGGWEATGIVRGRSLSVVYNEVMAWSDFEDGVYATAPCSTTHEVTNSRSPQVPVPQH